MHHLFAFYSFSSFSVWILTTSKQPPGSLPTILFECRDNISLLSRLLCVAADNLDLLCLYIVLIVELEINILNQKRPDIIAKSVRIKMTL